METFIYCEKDKASTINEKNRLVRKAESQIILIADMKGPFTCGWWNQLSILGVSNVIGDTGAN